MNLLYDSPLSDTQIDAWRALFPYLSAAEAENLLYILNANKGQIMVLTKNIEAKIDALTRKDLPAWETALQNDLSLVASV